MWLEETLKQFKRILLLISHSQVIVVAASLVHVLLPPLARGQYSTYSGWLLRTRLLCAQDFMNNVCTNVLRLHQKKLIPYGGEFIHISCLPKGAEHNSQDLKVVLHAQGCHTLHLGPCSLLCDAMQTAFCTSCRILTAHCQNCAALSHVHP